jgi:hypothetical protein
MVAKIETACRLFQAISLPSVPAQTMLIRMRNGVICSIAILAAIFTEAHVRAAIPPSERDGSKPSQAPVGKILKVLPHYLDLQGRYSLSPSLYERDAYQAFLRKTPRERSGIRFDIQCRSVSELKLRVEVRGAKGKELTKAVLEGPVKQRGFSNWTGLTLSGEDYQKFGELAAWRATLWDGKRLLSEQKSFLW